MTAGTAPNFSCSFDTTTLTDGNKYDFRMSAADNLGTSTTTTSTNVVIDNTDPTGSMNDPGSPLVSSVTLSANASDTGSGVASVVIQEKLSVNSTWNTACTSGSSSSPYTCSFQTKSVVDGKHDFRAVITDKAGRTFTTAPVTNRVVNNDTPAGDTSWRTADGGGTTGLAQQGDTVSYVYTEEMDPNTILSGWTGASTNVTVRINNSTTNDIVQVWNATNTTQANLGDIQLKGDYVTASAVFGGPGNTTNSTMSATAQSDGTYKITVTLGNKVSGTLQTTQSGTTAAIWTPVNTAKDLAGTAASTTAKTSSTAGPQF
jgi:hypothetical protein